VKWDVYRALITKDGDRVRIFSRSGAEYSTRLPRMVEAFARLPASSAVLDGELCYIGADGQAKFYALMRQMRVRVPDESGIDVFLLRPTA
jgi:bifunctional non-homologous end joining protein LigD